jgi:signal peptidase I
MDRHVANGTRPLRSACHVAGRQRRAAHAALRRERSRGHPPPNMVRHKRRQSEARQRRRPRRLFRRLVERAVLLVLAALALRTWYVEGLFVPLEVTSGSMAGALWGVHREVTCADCGHRFVCAADVRPISPRAICPNCGFAGNVLEGLPDIAGDRLLVAKSIFTFRSPRRWELACFRHPQRAGEICVKRVVGLPGESIQIRHGDVYVNGSIQRKTLVRQRAIAVLVYDATHPPRRKGNLPSRWVTDDATSGWGSANGRYAHASVPAAESVDWLVYRHWHRFPGDSGRVYEAPVTNHRGYNQTRPQREENVHSVSDLLLSFRLVRTYGEGRLLVRASDGGEVFEVVINPVQGRFVAYREGRPGEPVGHGRVPAWSGALHVEVSLFDQQFLLAFEGRPAIVFPYEPRDVAPRGSSRPLAIGSERLGLEIRDLRVYRDAYYTRPPGADARWGLDQPAQLGPGEFFVLGDNSPISEDSRTWPAGPAVAADLLVGKPFLVHFPARRLEAGAWHFQVPDPARIRYIR